MIKLKVKTLARNVCDFICTHKVARTYQDNKIGLVDLKGNILLPPVYQTIELHENHDLQKDFLSLQKDGKYGLAEKNGQMILEPKYEKLQYLAVTQYLYRQNGKYGFLRIYDKQLDKVEKTFQSTEWTPPVFEGVKFFETFEYSDIIPVKKEGKWGFLEKMWNGTFDTLIIDNQFNSIEHCWGKKKKRGHYPLFWFVQKESKWGIYNGYGSLIKEVVCDTLPILYDYYFRILENGKESFIDTDGKILSHKPQIPVEEKIPPKIFRKDNSQDFKEFKRISEKYAVFKEGEKWGILTNENMEQKYEVYLNPQFEYVDSRTKRRWIPITKVGIHGFFDSEYGKVILEEGYHSPQQINKRYLSLYKNGTLGIFDLKQEKLVKETSYDRIKSVADRIIIVSLKGKMGLFNLETAQEIVPIKYHYISKLNEKKQRIFSIEKNGIPHYGIMDNTGKIIIEPAAKKNPTLNEDGHYYLQFNQSYAKMDTNGKVIYTKPFAKKRHYNHQLAAVKMAESQKWGFVNQSDSLVIPPIFDEIDYLSSPKYWKGGIFRVKQEGRTGIIDTLRNIKFPPFPYEAIEEFAPNCIRVQYKDKFGLMDSLDNIFIPIEFEEIHKFDEEFLTFKKGNKVGLMNYIGEIIFEPQFHRMGLFYPESKHAIVHNSKEKRGVINLEGKLILPMIYDYIELTNLQGKRCFLLSKGAWQSLADEHGKTIIPMKYKNIQLSSSNPYIRSKNWIKCTLEGKNFYFDTKGKKVFSTKYKDIHLVSNTLAAIQLNKTSKWGLRNLQTKKWILKPIFDEFQSEGEAIKSFKTTPKMAYINRKGEYVWKENGFEMLE